MPGESPICRQVAAIITRSRRAVEAGDGLRRAVVRRQAVAPLSRRLPLLEQPPSQKEQLSLGLGCSVLICGWGEV
ncbi:hypothetical protein AAHA92_02957 [Salvia divinorum]|uniref:Uncharacterized protein n=1 Tax=Salvia divinorum TaxID=28513 RepID=A0ABD1IGK3_SALDI